ncbi:MAG TPA: cytochrome C oxidase subunit IV family protein [Bacillales bacterium]|nr:cytochrome C oxidase subunit IV family protein [Bacillales bacterium]
MSHAKTGSKNIPLFPMKNVIGFGLSLILTFAALGLGAAHILPFGIVMMILMGLAVLQIAVQLFFFMHFMESDGPPFHVAGLAIGVIFTIAIVAMSVWIMSFNSMSH